MLDVLARVPNETRWSTGARPSVFETYCRTSWPHGTVRMVVFTADTAGLIASEPGVLVRETRHGHEVFTLGGQWVPLQFGEYVVRYGDAPDQTAVVGAGYVHEHYTREPIGAGDTEG